jgi:uncharacterized protein (DUF169 family)
MEQWMQMGRKLRELVNPSTMPVAVKFLKEEDQIPVKARRPLRDLKVKMAPCQGSAMARCYGRNKLKNDSGTQCIRVLWSG